MVRRNSRCNALAVRKIQAGSDRIWLIAAHLDRDRAEEGIAHRWIERQREVHDHIEFGIAQAEHGLTPSALACVALRWWASHVSDCISPICSSASASLPSRVAIGADL